MNLIAATFVAEPIAAPLGVVLGAAGIAAPVDFAPYNQVLQQLLTPGSAFALNKGGVNIVLVRVHDFVRDQSDPELALSSLSGICTELGNALRQFAARSTDPLVLVMPPASPGLERRIADAAARAAGQLRAAVAGLPGLHILDLELTNSQFGGDEHDPVRDQYAHIPYTEEYFAALALALGRLIHAIRVPPAKVLVLDCDNTLWRGVVGEDGVEGIELTDAFLKVQEFAVALEGKGILVCLASKNTEADVLAVFETRRDMRLKLEHIAAHRVNWLPKPTNIRALAQELNLGLDAFVFIDDNPVECAQVRAELPSVITLQLPPDAEVESFLKNLWVFDKLVSTAEDRERTRMYRENAARQALESTATDIADFLESLNIKIEINPPDEAEWPRVAQLTQRTNQFNFLTGRRTEAELRARAVDGESVLRVRVKDRFGDYGLVGVIETHREADSLSVDNLMLSCRVLGRGVEHAMLRRLGEIADAAGLAWLCLPLVATARNEPARAFADSVAAQYRVTQPAGALYRIPVAAAMQIEHRPGQDPEAVLEARRAEDKKGTAANVAAAPSDDSRSDRYAQLASKLDSGSAIMGVLASRRITRQLSSGPATAPASDFERQLLEIWEEVLSTNGIGVDDDYVALGGTSLLSVRLFAQIERRFGVQLRLTSILEAPTVRSLARLIAASRQSARRDLVCLRAGSRRNLFLVHDGLGETLLYVNLARMLPPGVAVYGVEPKSLPGIPLAHASIEDMAGYYVERVREIQPQGPYFLGGMCAGGTIAYAMAARLESICKGSVQLVTILDGATPTAVRRSGARLSRLRDALASGGEQGGSAFGRFATILATVTRKAFNVAAYESRMLWEGASLKVRFALFRRLIASGGHWPRALRQLTVAQIYSELESRYRPPALSDVPVLLVRAREGEGGDTPFRELYCDAEFGWRECVGKLETADVEGGHSSMLQLAHVHSLVAVLAPRVGYADAPVASEILSDAAA